MVGSSGIKKQWQWSENKYICSKHFKESNVIKLGHKTFLKSDAMPSLESTRDAPTRNIEIASTSTQEYEATHCPL